MPIHYKVILLEQLCKILNNTVYLEHRSTLLTLLNIMRTDYVDFAQREQQCLSF